jgi:CHASE3 domain sensor protein
MDRLYMDEYDEGREKGDQVLIELRSQHEDDKCRRHSSQNLWIASEDSIRD